MADQLMNTINGTYDRAVKEGLGISKNLIRSLVKSGTIPCVHVGNNQTLINFQVLKNFLFTGSPTIQQSETTPGVGQIKQIPEKLRAFR